jgi:uncharacterized UBP type Zn finger protein
MACHHFDDLKPVAGASASYKKGCEDCLKIGGQWVHLRECLICGHVGCCDSSPNRHATKHFHATKHPVMRSVEPGEEWGYCYVDEVMVNLAS